MKLLSVQCGLPRQVLWHGTEVTTSIYKDPVAGRVALRTLNLDGDRQSDLSVHGGQYKAVYCYRVEHYAAWRAELPGRELNPGAFGENFTIEGLPEETSIRIGDRFSIGSAEVVVTQPRLPCYKLGIKFGSDHMVKRFLASGRSGFYLAVTREGEVGAGDEVIPISCNPESVSVPESESVSVADIVRLYIAKEYNSDDLRKAQKALTLEALPASWKDWLREEIHRLAPATRNA